MNGTANVRKMVFNYANHIPPTDTIAICHKKEKVVYYDVKTFLISMR